ncbi:MAG: hypothetical protein PHQ23_11505 [Candidatus Wallbacteria bacterium]|nr:hypothetical protein [Candidatus Wallbacteria bacterium]
MLVTKPLRQYCSDDCRGGWPCGYRGVFEGEDGEERINAKNMKKWKNVLIFLVWLMCLYWMMGAEIIVPVNMEIDSPTTIHNRLCIAAWWYTIKIIIVATGVTIIINKLFKRLSNH